MTFDQIITRVLPYVDGCPYPLVQEHLINAARSFARRTRLWNVQLAPIAAVADQAAYTLASPVTGASICALLAVYLDGSRYVVRSGPLARRNTLDGRGNVAMFDTTSSVMTLTPAPTSATSLIYVDVALEPKTDGTSGWPDQFEDEAEFLAAGAIGSLCGMPRKEWRDVQTAAEQTGKFNSRIATVYHRVAQQFIPSDRASSAVYL